MILVPPSNRNFLLVTGVHCNISELCHKIRIFASAFTPPYLIFVNVDIFSLDSNYSVAVP